MSWKPDSWNKAEDGSAMKVSEDNGVLKTERISSTENPHEHDIVKTDVNEGKTKEITVGKNVDRK